MTTSILEQATELREKAQEMLAKAKELEQKVKKENKVQLWKPSIGNMFYYVSSGGTVDYTFSTFSSKNFNWYRTAADAQRAVFEERITRMLKKLAEALNQPDCACNYYIVYDVINESLKLQEIYLPFKNCGTIYCSSTEFLNKAIELIGEDDLIKYIRGY